MLNLGRVGIDVAGGTIVGPGAINVYCNGARVCLVGDAVAGHGKSPHSSPVMVTCSKTVFCNGRGVCRLGDSASCGHTLAPGSFNTFAG